MNSKLKKLIKRDLEESQVYAENRVLRNLNFELENQVLELNEKISSMSL